MERIHKLPFILGCLAAIATGIASYLTGAESQTIYLRMAVMMLIFFLIGIYTRNTILSIDKEVQENKLQKARAEEQQLRQQIEEEKAASSEPKHQTLQQRLAQKYQAHTVDLTAEDTGDDFEPLTISKAISSKVKE